MNDDEDFVPYDQIFPQYAPRASTRTGSSSSKRIKVEKLSQKPLLGSNWVISQAPSVLSTPHNSITSPLKSQSQSKSPNKGLNYKEGTKATPIVILDDDTDTVVTKPQNAPVKTAQPTKVKTSPPKPTTTKTTATNQTKTVEKDVPVSKPIPEKNEEFKSPEMDSKK